MTVQGDIDTAMVTLKSAIAAYSAAGGNRYVLAQWLIGQIKDADQGVAYAVLSSGTQFTATPPDRRAFAAIG